MSPQSPTVQDIRERESFRELCDERPGVLDKILADVLREPSPAVPSKPLRIRTTHLRIVFGTR